LLLDYHLVYINFILLLSYTLSRILVIVRFRAIGNAPILKQNLYKINASNKFSAVIQFLRRELNYKASDPLVKKIFGLLNVNFAYVETTLIINLSSCLKFSQFLYINSAFSPAPDEIVANLVKVF
jgi:ubiquitin-like protein ATG12